jgi:uncharacterized protein (TIGR03032 family)
MSEPTEPQGPVRIECGASDSFTSWMSQVKGTLAISTYQAGKVALVGWAGNQVTLLMRDFDKPLGIAVSGQRMALATRHEIWQFANAPLLAPEYLEDQPGRYDALFLPRIVHYVGDLHIHDLAYSIEGLLAVNTRFSCLIRLSADFNFEPIWRPNFVSDLVPEDRCHLNGLALRDGKPKYVTVMGTTDAAGGWRANKASGGLIVDVERNETVLSGLSMPHSPRWYNGALWFLNSGTGELWVVDPDQGRKNVVCALPGYLRGLAFVGPYALIGLSKIREKHIFGGLPVQERFSTLQCGVAVVDLRSGQCVGMFEFTAGASELYDVQYLPGILRPMIVNLDRKVIREAVTNPDSSYWLRASKEIKDDAPSGPAPQTETSPLQADPSAAVGG